MVNPNSSKAGQQLTGDQFIRYSRQIMLEDWGEQTQIQLGRRHVVIVGAGGLANIAASYLAGAGVGKLSIIDGDEVELSNLPRQIAFDLDSLENAKVYELANRLRQQNDQIELLAHHLYLDDNNATRLLSGCDLVLDCTDNIKTRQLINRCCVTQQLPLLSASVAQWQGQLMLIDPNQPQFGCYHCLFPFDETAANNSCRTLGVSGPMVGVLGSLQATQALKFLNATPAKLAGKELAGKFYCIDGRELSVQSFSTTRNKQCPVCMANAVTSAGAEEKLDEQQ